MHGFKNRNGQRIEIGIRFQSYLLLDQLFIGFHQTGSM